MKHLLAALSLFTACDGEVVDPPLVVDTALRDSVAVETDEQTDLPVDSDTDEFHVDTDLPPWAQTAGPLPPTTPNCMIPAPGSLAAQGAISELHLIDVMSLRPDGVGVRRPFIGVGESYSQNKYSENLPISLGYHNGQGGEFLSIFNMMRIFGPTSFEDVELARIEGLPFDFSSPPQVEGGGVDLDGDGLDELIGTYYFRDPFWDYTKLVYAWSIPLPRFASVLDAQWRFTNSDWTLPDVDAVGAGDWNHDGFDDLLIGGNYHSIEGRTDVLVAGPFGPPSPGQVVDIASHVYATIRWHSPWASNVSVVTGDYNGDGIDDLVLNAIGGAGGVADINIWFGPIQGEIDGWAPDVQIHSTQHPANFPYLKLFPIHFGDIDGNGADDLIVSAPNASDRLEHLGATHIFLGPFRRGHHLADTEAWATIRWVHVDARTGGGAVRAVPDVNGDGRPDLLLTAPYSRSDLEPQGATVPRAPLPPGVELTVPGEGGDSDDTGLARAGVGSEGAVMLFTDLRPGDLGPEDAAIVLKGSQPGADLHGIAAFDDLDGDGLGDVAILANELSSVPTHRVHILRPCRDWGERVGP
jgi:hypothetical protein